MDVSLSLSLSLVRAVYCQAQVSVSGWSVVQTSSTECGESWVCVWLRSLDKEEALAH